jgi:hypothetical protein
LEDSNWPKQVILRQPNARVDLQNQQKVVSRPLHSPESVRQMHLIYDELFFLVI